MVVVFLYHNLFFILHRVLTLCRHLVSSPCVLTLSPHLVSRPCVLTFVLTLFFTIFTITSSFIPQRVPTLCLHLVLTLFSPFVLTVCLHRMSSPYFLTIFTKNFFLYLLTVSPPCVPTLSSPCVLTVCLHSISSLSLP